MDLLEHYSYLYKVADSHTFKQNLRGDFDPLDKFKVNCKNSFRHLFDLYRHVTQS